MIDKEFGSLKLLKLKCRRADQIIQPFCRITPPPPNKLGPPVFNWNKFQKSEKAIPESCRILWNLINDEEFGSTPELCRMYWNLINDEEFGPLKFLTLKYRKGNQIIQSFCRIRFPQEIRSTLFNLWKFENAEKITPESSRRHINVMNHEEFGSLKLLNWNTEEGTK